MTAARLKLKSPYPYFGGKSRICPLVWRRFGSGVLNYIEPFYGSGAVHLARPEPWQGVETVNDIDCYVANFWRATQHQPDKVVEYCDWPVNEVDLHARHNWLVNSPASQEFRDRMRSDPHYHDCQIAGWWVWGICCWIGGGWCVNEAQSLQNRRPAIALPGGEGNGVHGKAPKLQLPSIAGDSGASGRGIHRKTPKRPSLSGDHPAPGGNGKRVHRGGRPQLADAYDVGRGVHAHGELGTCASRREWLLEWFGRLRDRLRLTRVCCLDWRRVCSSESVTTRLGITAVFLDPPYGDGAGRDMGIYACDSGSAAGDVRSWCLENGPNPKLRVTLCGYEGEGHEQLEAAGWRVESWQAQGGYGNRTSGGKKNARRERIWFSPHCIFEGGLFDAL